MPNKKWGVFLAHRPFFLKVGVSDSDKTPLVFLTRGYAWGTWFLYRQTSKDKSRDSKRELCSFIQPDTERKFIVYTKVQVKV